MNYFADIQVDIPSADFKVRLESEVPGLGEVNVRSGGNCYSKYHYIDWVSSGGNKPAMEVSLL